MVLFEVLFHILNLFVIVSAVIGKLPQITKILMSHSAENISYLAKIQELVAITFVGAYNFGKSLPFSYWAENFFLAIQVMIILTLMFYYNQNLMYLMVFAPVYGVVVWYLTSQYVSLTLLTILQGCVIPLMISSRLSQIVTTYMNGTTGQLSVATIFLNWLRNLIRICTSFQMANPLLVVNYSSSFLCNTIIMFQFYWYWNVDKKKV